jgi:hypothetical protein
MKRFSVPADFLRGKIRQTATGQTRRFERRDRRDIAVIEVTSSYGLPTEYLVAEMLTAGENLISRHRKPNPAFEKARTL